VVMAVRVIIFRMLVGVCWLPGVLVPGLSGHESGSLRWCDPDPDATRHCLHVRTCECVAIASMLRA
jgi:hypothetical protein